MTSDGGGPARASRWRAGDVKGFVGWWVSGWVWGVGLWGGVVVGVGCGVVGVGVVWGCGVGGGR